MTTTIIDKALRRVADDVAALIEEHGDAIRAAISNQMLITAEEDDEAKLVFSLGIASKITPQGDKAQVSTSIAWAVKEKKSTDSTVSDQPELPLEVLAARALGWDIQTTVSDQPELPLEG